MVAQKRKLFKWWQIMIVSSFVVFSLYTVRSSAQEQSDRTQQLDAYFRRLSDDGFSGAVLIVQQGHVLLDAGYGLADQATGQRISSASVFDIGSISKQFTAAAVLQLEARGQLAMNAPISSYLADVPVDKQAITLHHLLTHTSGLGDHGTDDLEALDRNTALQRIFTTPLEFQPGSSYRYSNSGYTLAAMIIENVSKQPFTEYLRTNLFTPIDLRHTSFYGNQQLTEFIPRSYINGADVGSPAIWPGPFWVTLGNGGVVSTTGDLYAWWNALRTAQVLPSAQTAALFTRATAKDEPGAFYGYGWSLEDSPYGPLISHEGGGIGGNSIISYYSDHDLLLIILSNRMVYRTFFDSIPYEVYRYAYDTQQQLVPNLLNNEFTALPRPTLSLGTSLLIGGGGILGLISGIIGVLWLVRYRRKGSQRR
jgi:CubicO group peptidase (beta-lactamase class C family)